VLSFFFELGASCIRPVYYGLRPFAPFEYTLLIKKMIMISYFIFYSSFCLVNLLQRIPLKFDEEQGLWILSKEMLVSVFHYASCFFVLIKVKIPSTYPDMSAFLIQISHC
jgi:hypothetical protein